MVSELQAIAESLAARLQRAVAIDDPHMHLLVHTPHYGDVDRHRLDSILHLQAPAETVEYALGTGIAKATGPVRVPGNTDMELLPRVCAPIRAQDELLGYLWLIDADESLTDADLAVVDESARAAGPVLYRARLLEDLERGREREMLRDLLSDDAPAREHAAELIGQSDQPIARNRVVCLVAEVLPTAKLDGDLPVALDPVLHRLTRRHPPGTCVFLARADHAVVIAAQGRGALRDEEVDALAVTLQSELAKAVGGDVRVGVGAAVDTLAEVVASYRQARQAIRVARIVPGFGDVADFGRLGIYALLVQLPWDGLPREAVPEPLRRLFELDTTGQLVETLETYLDRAGDARATVAALCIHRTTLYYRLSRIQELTGLDLADGGTRLAVHLGLKLARLTPAG